MNLLITGASSPLGQALAARLRHKHSVRLTDHDDLETDLDFARSDLGHDESTDALVQGIDALIHCPRPDGEDAAAWLDLCSRRTYNLLMAAVGAGVRQVLYISTLDLFDTYDEDLLVTETWRPRPTCEPSALGLHIGEFVAKEFAHDGALKVLCLRLGHLIDADAAADRPFDPMWVETRDAVGAVEAALERLQRAWDDPEERGLPNWGALHLQAAGPRARFSSRRIQRMLDFSPRFNFEETP